jgi:hypothetical protein
VGIVVNTCNPKLRRLRQEDLKFEANLGYIARPCTKNIYMHIFSSGEKTGRSIGTLSFIHHHSLANSYSLLPNYCSLNILQPMESHKHWARWLTPIILATWKVEIGIITV